MNGSKGWDVSAYEARFKFVSDYGATLIDLLDPQPGEHILDLGCGTGHLTRQIADYDAQVTGMDRSPEMVRQAQALYPDLAFVVGDGADFRFDIPFDAVFSNAALHWITNPEAVIDCVRRALKPGGRFVAEMGGQGNIQSIREAVAAAAARYDLSVPPAESVWYFPGVAEYATLLENAGFRVTLMIHFDRPTVLDGQTGIADFLHMFGTTFLDTIPDDKRPSFIQTVEDLLRPSAYQGDHWIADYVRLRFIALNQH